MIRKEAALFWVDWKVQSLSEPNLFAQVSLLAKRERGAELAALSFCHSHCLYLPNCSRAKHVVTWNWTPGWFGGNGPLPLLHNPVSGIVKLNLDQMVVLVPSFSHRLAPSFLPDSKTPLRLEPRHVSHWPAAKIKR